MQKVSRNHEFQSGENIVPEVKLRCEEHKEDFIFVVTIVKFRFAYNASPASTRATECPALVSLFPPLRKPSEMK